STSIDCGSASARASVGWWRWIRVDGHSSHHHETPLQHSLGRLDPVEVDAGLTPLTMSIEHLDAVPTRGEEAGVERTLDQATAGVEHLDAHRSGPRGGEVEEAHAVDRIGLGRRRERKARIAGRRHVD